MRTKTISRWRKAALATAAAASLALPARAQEAGTAAPAPAPAENGQIPATSGPPAAAPADGPSQEYTIQRGDTLWDLSQKFLANPWYWPKIWSLNPAIENPHWIYPGQKLQIKAGAGGSPAQVEAPANAAPGTEEAAAAAGESTGVTVAPPATEIGVTAAASESAAASQMVTTAGRLVFQPPAVLKVNAVGLVSQDEVDNAGVLDASFEEKQMIATWDTAYVRFKKDGAAHIGDKLTIFHVDGEIDNAQGEKLAIKTKTVGDAKVISINGDVVTVQITGEREEIGRGDLVRPWVDESRRLAPKSNAQKLDGTILSSVVEGPVELGRGQQVFIDKGKNDGVQEGNTFMVIHRGDGLGSTGSNRISYTQGDPGDETVRGTDPDETVGLLMVIETRDNVSTAVVVRSIRELEAGDRIQMRPAGG